MECRLQGYNVMECRLLNPELRIIGEYKNQKEENQDEGKQVDGDQDKEEKKQREGWDNISKNQEYNINKWQKNKNKLNPRILVSGKMIGNLGNFKAVKDNRLYIPDVKTHREGK